MTQVRVVVIELVELQRMIVEAVRSAASQRSDAIDWVDARSSGLGRRTFLRLAHEGAFPVSKRGKTYVARRADVDDYLARQRIEPTQTPLPPQPRRPPEAPDADPIAAALVEGRLRLVKKPP